MGPIMTLWTGDGFDLLACQRPVRRARQRNGGAAKGGQKRRNGKIRCVHGAANDESHGGGFD